MKDRNSSLKGASGYAENMPTLLRIVCAFIALNIDLVVPALILLVHIMPTFIVHVATVTFTSITLCHIQLTRILNIVMIATKLCSVLVHYAHPKRSLIVVTWAGSSVIFALTICRRRALHACVGHTGNNGKYGGRIVEELRSVKTIKENYVVSSL